ncbi:hypothetical protein [Streptomyces sp. NPDC059278]|uniref:hypothetical protein n=1 Tax=Streptomyces sp. NPDC059278 TaxID=3346801 RepID=UPI0036CF847C
MTEETKPKKPPHRPTKLCPHRLCRPLHLAYGVCGIAVLARDLWQAGIAFILFMVLLLVIVQASQNMVWKKSARDLAIEDQAQCAGGIRLVVRPVWARLAVATDAFFLFIAVSAVAHIAEPQDYSLPAPSVESLTVVAIAVGIFAFSAYAHRKATEPARPLRVPVAAPAEGGA